MPLTLGILGGGQLAKMLANEAYRMGLNVAIIENEKASPAGDMTHNEFTPNWNNAQSLADFVKVSDIVTLESEFINPDILSEIERSRPVFPSAKTIALVQDKFIQKSTFRAAGIAVPDFSEVNTKEDALSFGEVFGYPFLLKTRTLGYDGYGNFTVKQPDEIDSAFEKFSAGGVLRPLMAEAFVDFTKELAVMVARSTNGETEIYPCVETIQENHICHIVIAPAAVSDEQAELAKKLALDCVLAIDGVGVFGIEMFLTSNGKVLVNEIAPRPHNSGHYTIEACYTSQYENAIRAITGLPLGSAEMVSGGACMINLLGKRDGSGVPEDVTKMMTHKKAHLHLYGKKKSRKGRKMGHITALGKTAEEALQIAKAAEADLKW